MTILKFFLALGLLQLSKGAVIVATDSEWASRPLLPLAFAVTIDALVCIALLA